MSSDVDVAIIDFKGNIIPKSKGQFYIIVTNMNGQIIYTTPYFIKIN